MKLAAPLAILLLAACSPEPGAPAAAPAALGGEAATEGLVLTDGYLRPVAEGAMATAGYAVFESAADDALMAASAPGFAAVELHNVTEEDGIMRMRRVDRIALPAGEPVALAPGGYHVMLMGPEMALAEGDTVAVTFSFESGRTLTVEMPAQRR